jgi:gliding motility-associated-like protein
MATRNLFLFLGLFFVLNGTYSIKAQSTVPLVLNEYCVSNVPAIAPSPTPIPAVDEVGEAQDFVELYNNHTAPINLSNFYLSNDKNNLKKWKFPASVMQPGDYKVIWLSGKNITLGENVHTNFNIDQCKNQWIILSNAAGVIYDEVKVRPAKAGHSWGRVDKDVIAAESWRIFTAQTAKFPNGTPAGTGYAPTPIIVTSSSTNFDALPNAGGFYADGGQIAYFRLNGQTFDTTYSCYDIFYTKNGDYPKAILPVTGSTFYYADSTKSNIAMDKTTIIRAIAVLNPTRTCPASTELPSFCETNTYFTDIEYTSFDPNFGVLSIALDQADQGWFNTNGTATTVHVEYYDNKVQVSEGYAMITRPPQELWATAQKGFYINKDDRFGFGCNFEGNIFNVEGLGTTPRRVFPTLHLKAGDYESHAAPSGTTGVSYGTGIRDIVMQSIAAKYDLKVSPLHIKPCVAFVNGVYWGVYDLREVYDKYYENYYNGQAMDSLDLDFVNQCQETWVSYWDGTFSHYGNSFNLDVYNTVNTKSMKGTVVSNSDYKKVIDHLDKESFIDYMVLNSYAMNGDLWCHNVTLARGGKSLSKKGGKWHFYLWSVPSAFNFTAINPTGGATNNVQLSPCNIYNTNYVPTTNAFNAHGRILKKLFDPLNGNFGFQLEYKNRYQDLLNGPLKCDNVLKQFDFVYNLFLKEMKYHEDPSSTPRPGKFFSKQDLWDTNMAKLRKIVENRCYYMNNTAFNAKGCYGLTGPYAISVDVTPQGSGKVKLNSVVLDSYPWYGSYYQTTMSFKAIATNTDYAFHHWEFRDGPVPNDPLSWDSVGVNFNRSGSVLAVFTDKRNPISSTGDGANLPTGFTPNGDDLNEIFRPLGSGEFVSEFQMTIFNRWGQEVFRSIDPLDGWDGRYKGQEAQTGVYAYFITYKNVYNESKLVKGNVTLTR